MANAERIAVEVVVATPDKQRLVQLDLPAGTTAGEAVSSIDFGAQFPDLDIAACPIAVWGELSARDRELRNGDRVELLRPLEIDPRDARRELANAGRFMGADKDR